MIYDMQLGLLATQALSDLLLAEETSDSKAYLKFLAKSAEFCRIVRQNSPEVDLSSPASAVDVAAFVSAVMRVSASRYSDLWRERLKQVSEIEPIIAELIRKQAQPDSAQQLQIAEVLYATSSADLR